MTNMSAFHHFTKALGMLACISSMYGCVSIDNRPYPANWEKPSALADGVCPDINGAFQIASADTKGPPGLMLLFWNSQDMKNWPDNWLDLAGKHVVIKQSKDTLQASFVAASRIVAEKILIKNAKNGYSCTKGVVVIKPESFPSQNLLGYVDEEYQLFKSSDGLMIVRYHESGGGLGLGIIPMAGSDTRWDRANPYRQP